jgi:hypothetical protein
MYLLEMKANAPDLTIPIKTSHAPPCAATSSFSLQHICRPTYPFELQQCPNRYNTLLFSAGAGSHILPNQSEIPLPEREREHAIGVRQRARTKPRDLNTNRGKGTQVTAMVDAEARI